MAERYTRLSSLPKNQYAVGSPIVIVAGALLKDNQTGKLLAQVKFKNISPKQIKAIKVSVSAFDVSGKELEGVAEYQYLDLSATRTAEFGHRQAITLPDAVTRSIEVKCTDVFFTDGTVWYVASDAVWKSLPTQENVTTRLGNLAKQYQQDTSSKSKYIPLDYEDLWLCSCGAINHDGETNCHNCRHSKGALFVALDIDTLQQRDAEYKAAEAEKTAKQAAAEAAQRAKTTKITIIAAAVIAVVAFSVFVAVKVIIPNGKYNDAVALMDAQKYEEAIVAFAALEGYKDSADQISACEIAILDGKYDDAFALMDAGKYTEAIAAFEALDGYKDSADQITKCNTAIMDSKYNDAVALMDGGNIVEAYEALDALDGYKDSADKANSIHDKYMVEKLKSVNVGDYVFFGAYEQDNNTSNGKEKIEWLVLAKEGDKALIISKYALDYQQYNTSYTDVAWKNCTLRKWLNDTFINNAFSAEEQAMISTVTVSVDENPEYSSDPSKATQDKVFLLSINEANKYFTSDEDRKCAPTDYAIAQGVRTNDGYETGGKATCCWWLHSAGYHQNYDAVYVVYDGDVNVYSNSVLTYFSAVRPALWIVLGA